MIERYSRDGIFQGVATEPHLPAIIVFFEVDAPPRVYFPPTESDRWAVLASLSDELREIVFQAFRDEFPEES